MRLRAKGLILTALHLVLVLGLGGKLLLDRAQRPRFWLRAEPVDPSLPIRGRYVDLAVSVPVSGKELALDHWSREKWVECLRARNPRLRDADRKGPSPFGPSAPWTPGQGIPQIRIECRGSEVWGHFEEAPAGSPGLYRRDSARSHASVGIDLSEENPGRLIPEPPQDLTEIGLDAWLESLPSGRAFLGESLAFFIPEHVPDPSRLAPGEELWVEVTLPKKGPLRPIRLAKKKDGRFTPL